MDEKIFDTKIRNILINDMFLNFYDKAFQFSAIDFSWKC